MLLGLYDSAADETRVAAFLALRKLAVAADASLRESVIKVCSFPLRICLQTAADQHCLQYAGHICYSPRLVTTNVDVHPAIDHAHEELCFGIVLVTG